MNKDSEYQKSFEEEGFEDGAIRLGQEELESAKIFLIDDEPIVLELYEEYLSAAGFTQIFSFTDSVEAIETLRYLTPSIIVTDITMPEVSGTFLIKLLRTYEHLQTVPVVAATANNDKAMLEGLLRKGADAIIQKPVSVETFAQVIKQILQSTLKLQNQIAVAEEHEQQKSDQKKAEMISIESNLRDMMR